MLLKALLGHVLLHCSLSAPIVRLITVPSGQIIIQEQVRVEQIKEHLHMWVSEVSYSTDKLEKLLTARTLRESSFLLQNVYNMICGHQPQQDMKQTTSTPDGNSLRRQKRNVLGDFLHAITGVATEEQLQAQARLDMEIRDKIKDTLSRQVTFEQTISTMYGNLTREEEKMAERVDRLYNQRSKDKAQMTRYRVLAQVARDDIETLEDIVDSIWRGEAGSRHTLRLADMAGLPNMAKLTVESISCEHNVPIIRYTSMMHKHQLAQIMDEDTHLRVQTTEATYLLHKGHSLHYPLSTYETTTTNIDCSTCSILVHVQEQQYKVIRAGELTCMDGRQLNMTQGAIFQPGPNITCWNSQVKIGGNTIGKRTYTLNTSGGDRMDSLIMERDRKDDSSFVVNATSSKQEHLLTTLKLQHELNLAQQDLDNFVVDTQINKNTQYMQDVSSWGVMGVTALAVLIIIICILFRYFARKKGSMVIVNTPPNTNSV